MNDVIKVFPKVGVVVEPVVTVKVVGGQVQVESNIVGWREVVQLLGMAMGLACNEDRKAMQGAAAGVEGKKVIVPRLAVTRGVKG